MSLAERIAEVHTDAKILTLDIETQRGVWESFAPKVDFLPAARCLVPPRILCAAGKWVGDDKVMFTHAWRDDDADAMTKMLTTIHRWMNEADIIITYNGDRFDLTWCEQACSTVPELGRIKPYKSIDLLKLARRKFGAGLTYKSLDWSARMYLKESKLAHGGRDLWHDIRHGNREAQREAQKTMKQYNIRDVELTERLWLETYLPYSPVNLGLYRAHADDELLTCTTCGTTGKLIRDGLTYTGAFGYQLYRCEACGGISRGKRAKVGTELRSVR